MANLTKAQKEAKKLELNKKADSAINSESRIDRAHDRRGEKRVPMATGANLSVPIPVDPNYHYRWFEDNNKGRIEKALNAWYEFCYHDNEERSKISRPSGKFEMFLMRIEKKYWDEDQAIKQNNVVKGLAEAAKVKEDEYLPDGNTQAIQKDGFIDPLA